MRLEIKQNTPLGQQLSNFLNAGKLCPDEMVVQLVSDKLKKFAKDKGFILDGFPRNINQAKLFQSQLALDLVINFTIPEKHLITKIAARRLCKQCGANYNLANVQDGKLNMPPILPKVPGVCDYCGSTELIQREDDKEEIVKKRLDVYKKETIPLIDFYENLEILVHLESNGVAAVMPELIQVMDQWNKK